MKSRLQQLEELAKMYPTDKNQHGYLTSYAEFLPEYCNSLLEIGVAKGDSLLLWNSFYKNTCDISGLDLFEDKNHVTPRWLRNRNFVPYICNQIDINRMDKILHTDYNVVIEDGSHNSPDQLITFKHIFVNNLKNKGLWITEDCHCCKEPFYWGGMVESFSDTILAMFQRYQKSKKIINPYFSEGEASVFENLIEGVEIVNEKIIFVWKR